MAEMDIGIYLTGVATDGDAQSDPNSSLGGKRSGTVLKSLSTTALANVTGVLIDDVSSSSGIGTATLSFDFAATTLSYTAPGDTVGAAADVSTDGTYQLYSNDTTKYAVVTVTSASLPSSSQSDSVTLSNLMENLFDSVSSTQAQAGSTEYRALIVRNDSAFSMGAMKVWIDTNTPFVDDTVEIAIEATSAGAIQSVANETTVPTALTFSTANSEANALSIGSLASGGSYGVWIKRVVTATTERYPENYFSLTFKADTV